MFNISSTPTNTIITPLAISQHTPLDLGELKPLGCYHHAINFLTVDGSLLTLHRFGKGFTPSGWLLRNLDFDRITYVTIKYIATANKDRPYRDEVPISVCLNKW